VTEPESREGAAGQNPAGPGGAYPEFAPYPDASATRDPDSTARSTARRQPPDENESTVSEYTASEPNANQTAASEQSALVPGFELQSGPAAAPAFAAPDLFEVPDPDAFAAAPGQPAPPPAAQAQGSWLHRTRMKFRHWRRSRPFWGGFFILLGGGEILFSEKAPLRVIVHFGLTGLAGYLIPAVMVLCGILVVFNPQQRLFYAILSVLLALATWPTSNLGGFFIGMLFGLIGGSLAFAWMPLSAVPASKPKAAKTKAHGNKPPKVPARG
jgi:hypothetical protein